MSRAYYNEIDPFCADWLRTLILFDRIAPGDVDDRSIEDVTPDDIKGYDQCHFFAGIGLWSLALRHAGWGDDRPVWTGSCPCQPFSAAGKGAGFADERHLWPAWHWLVRQRRPDVVLGEQVEGPAGDRWFDLVQDDLEAEGYACGQVVFPAAGVGAPHIRHRRYWLAQPLRGGAKYRPGAGVGAQAAPDRSDRGLSGERLRPGFEGATGCVANSLPAGRAEGWSGAGLGSPASSSTGELGHHHQGLQVRPEPADVRTALREQGSGAVFAGTLVESESEQEGVPGRAREPGGANSVLVQPYGKRESTIDRISEEPATQRAGSARTKQSCWADPDWIWCRDGKYRPVEPGTFPLAHGYPGRVGALRAYGNAICVEAARVFIEEAMKCL